MNSLGQSLCPTLDFLSSLRYYLLTNNSLIILSEKDQVVPTDEIYEKMKKYNIECIYIKGAYHADMFMTKEYDNTFDHINDFIFK